MSKNIYNNLIKYINSLNDMVEPDASQLQVVEKAIRDGKLPLVVFGYGETFTVALDERPATAPNDSFYLESAFPTAEAAREWAEDRFPYSNVDIL